MSTATRPAVPVVARVLVLGVVLAGLTVAGPTGAEGENRGRSVPAPPTAPPVTPILSARRDPTWLDDTLATQRLQAKLAAVTAGRIGGAKEAPGCVLVSQGGNALFRLDPTAELLPASNMKLFTAAAGLDTLGAADRLTTTVAASAHPVGGKLTGNLYLLGGGDPDLMTAVYDAGFYFPEPTFTSVDRLAAAVRAAGITSVTGSVVADASRYDSLTGVPTWSPQYLSEGDVGPLSALEIDDGSPAATPATPPRPGPADPTLFAAQIFTQALKSAGVAVAGPGATGRTPAGAVTVTRTESAPLAAEVEQMLRVSDDTAAELLTKELGYRVSGQGTTAAGLAVIRRDLAATGLPVSQLVALDGSGLDRGDRVTCSLVTDLLQQAGTSGVIADGLPVAARSGTLVDRMAGTVAAGRLHAKTGTLGDVSALSGFVVPSAGAPTAQMASPVWFSIIVNGMDSSQAAPLVDRIGVAIAGYPDAVPLADLEPRT